VLFEQGCVLVERGLAGSDIRCCLVECQRQPAQAFCDVLGCRAVALLAALEEELDGGLQRQFVDVLRLRAGPVMRARGDDDAPAGARG